MSAIRTQSSLPVLFGIVTVPVFLLYIYHNTVRWDALFYYLFPANEIKLSCAAVIWLAGYGAGRSILRMLQPGINTVPEWVVAIGLGWSVIAYVMFVLALLQWFNVYAIAAVVLPLAVLGWYQSSLTWNGFCSILCAIISPWLSAGWLLRVIWLMIGLTVYYAVVSSLMPPTQSDGLRYHLTVPKLYLDAGGFYLIPNLSFSNFPFLIEYLYAIPLSTGQNSVPKLLHCSYFLLTVVTIYHAGKKIGGNECGWIAVLLLSTTPFVPIFASWSFIEFGLTFYTVLAFVLCCDWCEENSGETSQNSWRLAILIGLISGLAVCCKYTALASALAIAGLASLSFLFSKKTFFACVMSGGCIFIIALLTASPWFIKNYILLGNPVYPFASSIFPTPGWSEFNAEFFAYHAGLKGAMNVFAIAPLSWKIWDIVTLPFYATFFPGEAFHQPHNFGAWSLGAAWLAVVPLLLINRTWTPRYGYHLLFALFLYLLWAFTYRDTRFLLPCIAVLAPVSGLALWNVMKAAVWTRFLAGAIVCYNLCFMTGLLFIPESYAPWWVVSGLYSEEQYLMNDSRDTRWRNHAFRFLQENAERDEVVLFHGVDHGFYCPNPFIGADWFDTDPLIAMSWEASSVDDLIAKLKEQNVKYIVYDYGTIQRYNTDNQPYYRFFCLPENQSLPMLREWVTNEINRLHYQPVYNLWYPGFMLRLNTAYQSAPNVKILQELLNKDVLEEVYRFDLDENDPSEGIKVLKMRV